MKTILRQDLITYQNLDGINLESRKTTLILYSCITNSFFCLRNQHTFYFTENDPMDSSSSSRSRVTSISRKSNTNPSSDTFRPNIEAFRFGSSNDALRNKRRIRTSSTASRLTIQNQSNL